MTNSEESADQTVHAVDAAVELREEWNDELRADRFEVEIPSGREFVVDVVDGELRIRRKDDAE